MILTRKLKISESVIAPEMENWKLSSRAQSRDLWVAKVYSGLCNHQKLTPETSKSIPNPISTSTIYVIKWEMGIYRRERIRWILDVILIHLGTFKPMDRCHECLETPTWVSDTIVCCQFKSVSV